MKPHMFLIAGALALAACAETTADAEMETETMAEESMAADATMQLATQEDLAAIVGKTLDFGEGRSFVISADGTLAGDWGGTPLAGTYEMRDGFFCRTLTAGPGGGSPEDCQLFILNGDMLDVTRDRGNGSNFSYTIL